MFAYLIIIDWMFQLLGTMYILVRKAERILIISCFQFTMFTTEEIHLPSCFLKAQIGSLLMNS